jgi:metal-responsive CopG/Arc/MetJ family transcriptional regulator
MRKNKIIQVPMDEEFVAALDRLSEEKGESRSALIREACRRLLKQIEDAQLDREYEEGYRKFPEDPAEVEAWTQVAAEVLSKEDWEGW